MKDFILLTDSLTKHQIRVRISAICIYRDGATIANMAPRDEPRQGTFVECIYGCVHVIETPNEIDTMILNAENAR